jgi:hypothetical protein
MEAARQEQEPVDSSDFSSAGPVQYLLTLHFLKQKPADAGPTPRVKWVRADERAADEPVDAGLVQSHNEEGVTAIKLLLRDQAGMALERWV